MSPVNESVPEMSFRAVHVKEDFYIYNIYLNNTVPYVKSDSGLPELRTSSDAASQHGPGPPAAGPPGARPGGRTGAGGPIPTPGEIPGLRPYQITGDGG
eukprot:749489-Hanusia_phi.AAC.2